MMINGEPNANLLNPDGVHLNDRWISQLAASFKISDHDLLDVQERLRSRRRHYNRKSYDLPDTCTFIMRLFQLSFCSFFYTKREILSQRSQVVLYCIQCIFLKLYLYWRLLYFKSSISLRKESS